ncbi:MAG: hypothetical protein U0263_40285 [Polyangiaceae bacterium]
MWRRRSGRNAGDGRQRGGRHGERGRRGNASGAGGSAATGSGGAASGGGGSGGVAGEGATGGGGVGTGGSSSGCDDNAKHATSANRIIAEVSWPAQTGITAGNGTMYIWTKSVLDFGTADPSTGEIPATGEVTPLWERDPGAHQVGHRRWRHGANRDPRRVWDKPSMPKFSAQGTLSGFGVGATITMQPVISGRPHHERPQRSVAGVGQANQLGRSRR